MDKTDQYLSFIEKVDQQIGINVKERTITKVKTRTEIELNYRLLEEAKKNPPLAEEESKEKLKSDEYMVIDFNSETPEEVNYTWQELLHKNIELIEWEKSAKRVEE